MDESAPSGPSAPSARPAHYEIQIAEHLDERRTTWFDGLEIICSESGTILRGEIADQPALFGVLGQIRDLGLTLISVQRK